MNKLPKRSADTSENIDELLQRHQCLTLTVTMSFS